MRARHARPSRSLPPRRPNCGASPRAIGAARHTRGLGGRAADTVRSRPARAGTHRGYGVVISRFGVAALLLASAAQTPRARPVVVASKPFGESYLLAEMFAQLLEARGIRVDRRPGLGATEVAFRALTSGAIDVYPEYTGTGLLVLLHEAPLGGAEKVYARVAAEFPRRFRTRWLPPLGFENTYAIAMRRS